MGTKTRVCPYCAEEIKEAAVVCKHCGRELPGYEQVLSKTKNLETTTQPEEGRLANKVGKVAKVTPPQEIALSDNFNKISRLFEDLLTSIRDEEKAIEAKYEEIYKNVKFINDSELLTQLTAIDKQWDAYHHRDVRSPSAIGSMKVRSGLIDICTALGEIADSEKIHVEELSGSEIWVSLAKDLMNDLKLGRNLTAFKIGLAIGENSQGADFESASAKTWNMIVQLVLPISARFDIIFIKELFSSEEIDKLKGKTNKLIFLLFLKYYRLGFERIRAYPIEHQMRKNEIEDLPNSIKSKLPLAITVFPDSDGGVQLSFNSRLSLSNTDQLNVMALSIPLISLHQMVTLRPSYRMMFKRQVATVYKNLRKGLIPLDAFSDSALRSVQIKLLQSKDALIPQFFPKFKGFSTNDAKEISVVKFLIGYQLTLLPQMDRVLQLSVMASVLSAVDWIDRKQQNYLFEIATKAWWVNQPNLELLEERIEEINKGFST
ncbi:MAG: hypothetical protein HYZ26_02540 [Chloroflexi bacterium]|nr:hypothetical protein [Chloroflexota bacterium]